MVRNQTLAEGSLSSCRFKASVHCVILSFCRPHENQNHTRQWDTTDCARTPVSGHNWDPVAENHCNFLNVNLSQNLQIRKLKVFYPQGFLEQPFLPISYKLERKMKSLYHTNEPRSRLGVKDKTITHVDFFDQKIFFYYCYTIIPPPPPPARSSSLLFLHQHSLVIVVFSFLPLRKKTQEKRGLIGSIPVPRTVLWIHRAPRPNVFMVMSVSSWQALEHHTQPHLIRTRLFDLLHYPVITQTGYWRTQGLVLITHAHIWGKNWSNQSQASFHSRGCCTLSIPNCRCCFWTTEGLRACWIHGWMDEWWRN